jgi:stage II sporulation protein D
VHTFYSADCGGRTSNNEDVLLPDMPREPLPYLRGVVDRPDGHRRDYCAASRHHQWTHTLTKAQLEARLNRCTPTRVGYLTEARFVAYDGAGRVKTVRLRGLALPPGMPRRAFIGPPPPVVREVDGWTYRRSVGWRVLKSTLVRLSHPAPDRYVFSGRGNGHGVGLCQIGANGMASEPYRRDFRQILAHYYPGSRVSGLGVRVAIRSLPSPDSQGSRLADPRRAATGPRRGEAPSPSRSDASRTQ